MESTIDGILQLRMQPLHEPDGTASRIRRRCQPGMILLKEAKQAALELNCNIWDFAVEIAELQRAGMTSTDLRWMACRDLLKHAASISRPGHDHREFRPEGKLCFSAATCFILSAAGEEFAADAVTDASPHTNGLHKVLAEAVPAQTLQVVPKWDRDWQELRVNGCIVKQFKVPAGNQEMILAAFEEEGWPHRIDDPLAPQPDKDPKRRLHDTINSLNRNQKSPLIRFTGDGSGQGIRWQLLSPPTNGDSHPA